MYLTHSFANADTQRRARYWLEQFGFHVEPATSPEAGVPRLTLQCNASQAQTAQVLIDSIEHADPKGWPGLYDVARMPHPPARPEAHTVPPHTPARSATPIRWHGQQADHEVSDPEVQAMMDHFCWD